MPSDTRVDWSSWKPTELACLCFICKGDDILLIKKKRGLGAGKVNGPGGRLEPGETALEAAVRETQEEILVKPVGLSLAGELYFDFVDGYRLHCTVFRAEDYVGEMGITDEAEPFWVRQSDVPYDAMWADDRHWLPLLIDKKQFVGRFAFDGEQMLAHDVQILGGMSST